MRVGVLIWIGLMLMVSTASAKKPCVCPAVNKPVCGQDDKTYRNACRAECKQVGVQCEGRCPCKKLPTCKGKKCSKPRQCRIVQGKARCVCPRLVVKCKPSCKRVVKVVRGCSVPSCRCPEDDCQRKCAKPRVCKKALGIEKCVCPRASIKCRAGCKVEFYKYKNKQGFHPVGACMMARCVCPKASCKNITCKGPRVCRLMNNKPACLCPILKPPVCPEGTRLRYWWDNGCRKFKCQ